MKNTNINKDEYAPMYNSKWYFIQYKYSILTITCQNTLTTHCTLTCKPRTAFTLGGITKIYKTCSSKIGVGESTDGWLQIWL